MIRLEYRVAKTWSRDWSKTWRRWLHNGRKRANTGPAVPRSRTNADAALWAALVTAGPYGASIADLMQATGKGRTWVYERLRQLADVGRVIQIIRGHWRAALPPR